MAFLDSSNQIFSGNRLDIRGLLFLAVYICIFSTSVKAECLRFSIGFWKIGNDIILSFENAGTIVREIQHPTSSASNNNHIACTKLYPRCVAYTLLNCLQELRICNAISFALYNRIRFFAFIIRENDNIRTVRRYTIRDRHLNLNAMCWVVVFVDQFRPEFSPNFFLGIVIVFCVIIRRDIDDLLLIFRAGNNGISIFNCPIKVSHICFLQNSLYVGSVLIHFLLRWHIFQKHHIINRQIRDLAVCRDLAGVGENIGLFHVIIVVLYEGIQGAVDGVVLTGLDLDGNGG